MPTTLITTLRTFFQSQPIDKAWLFGSYARGDQRPDSDIDILVRFTPGARISLMTYTGIICDLEDLLQRPIDLIQDGTLTPYAAETADKDKILVYERSNQGQSTA